MRDERLYERDLQIADHVLAIHAAPARTTGTARSRRRSTPIPSATPAAFLKRYVEYQRDVLASFGAEIREAAEDQYVRYRQEMRERAKRAARPRCPSLSAARSIEGLGESAKMYLQEGSEEHVQEALRLFEVSTIDAARSGAAEMVVLTPEQREELTLVETQIKQKLAIGASASKRHLAEDLARLGVNEWAVMRALMIMSQRGEIQERAEGRRVTRVH